MSATKRTGTLQRTLRIFILFVAIITLYLLFNDEQITPIRRPQYLQPLPKELKAVPCDINKAPNAFPIHNSQGNQPSRILYLLQTEECLPTHLRLALGDSFLCQCDVVVLSFRSICNDTSLPHVKYYFNSTTTWTTGRNFLYYSNIHKASEKYLYYILMDDDIELRWRDIWQLEHKNRDPWRGFEEFLKRVQPPVVTLQLLELTLERVEEIRASRNCCMDPEYTITVWFDAAFNAYHYKAVDYMLPYWDKMENESWWYSQLHQIAWAEIVFRGQVVMNRQLIAQNEQHRPYPRSTVRRFDSILPMIIEDIKERLAPNCQNAPLLKECEKKGFIHLRTASSTYCLLPPPPKQIIVPFRNILC